MAFQRAEAAGHPDTTFSGSNTPGAPGLASETWEEAAPTSSEAQTALDTEVEAALPEELRIDDPTLHSHDTVGAVALDQYGNLAAGTSTGGTLNKAPGRVGDSSLIGCGCYADNLSAAVSLTGWGEPIMKLVLGKWAVDRVAAGSNPTSRRRRSHRLPLHPPRRPRRHHPPRPRRPHRHRPQHPPHGLGLRHLRRHPTRHHPQPLKRASFRLCLCWKLKARS